MANRKGGLGRGFEALFNDNSTEGLNETINKLPIGEIEPNRNQPRKSFDEEELDNLADSIAQFGLIQPIVVRPMSDGSYQIVAGERRWRASRLAGLNEVPVIIKPLTDEETALLALVENLQRADLNPIEEAEGYRRLIEEYGITQEQASDKLGKSRSSIANSMRLLNLPDDVKEMVEEGSLSAGGARALIPLQDEKKINECAVYAVLDKMSVREIEAMVKSELAKMNRRPQKMKPLHEDRFYTEVELALHKTLGREITVKECKKGGKLVIEFFDKEDLQKLANLLED